MVNQSHATAPAPLPPLPFHIPAAVRHSFTNGLKVVLFQDDRFPLISVRLAFFSGDSIDPSDRLGLASATASMLNEGTASYSSKELAEKIERLGASLSAHAGDDFTLVSASSLSLYTSDMLDLIEEVVQRPVFPEQELDLYRRNAIEHLKFQRSQPNFLANEQTARLLYGEHPYSRVSPSASDIEKLTRQDLIENHAARFVPNNAILIAVGDIERDEFIQELEGRMKGWAPRDQVTPRFPELPQRDRRTLTIVDRTGSAQSNIVLSNLAIPRNHPDYFPALVMNQVLGAGASSRVFMNLREEKGYTYGAYTRLDTKKLTGDFEATAEVRTAVTGDSLKEFFYELNRIRDDRVTEQELADAKNFLTGVFPIRAETQEGLTNLFVNQFLYDLPEDYLQTYRDRIDSVSIDDVQEAAMKLVHPDRMALVIVGDADEILKQSRQYGDEIEVFDTEGKQRDLSSYGSDNTPAVDAAGNWKLTIDFQGQTVPVSLTLKQADASLSGTLETVFGNGEIASGSISGNKIVATAVTEIQGQKLDISISGKISGDTISGQLTVPIAPDAMTFTGTREHN